MLADACFLINFLAVDQIELLGRFVAYRFLVPLEVVGEVLRPAEADLLARATRDGILDQLEIVDLAETATYTGLLDSGIGSGEAACLAVAFQRGWIVASDERGRFRRLAVERIGADRLLTTPMALSMAVEAGLLHTREARQLAEALRDSHRFTMRIPEDW